MTTFSERAWAEIEPIRQAIDELPFVTALGDGSLDGERFAYYLAQDAHYLDDYARALAASAAKAPRIDEVAFFAKAAHDAVMVESELHRKHVSDIETYRRSPTCAAYTSYLLGVAQTRDYAELVAAVLPCFWIYADVGSRLLERAGELAAHPYGDWIGMYADEEFAEATAKACGITDRVAAEARSGTVDRMSEAFATAARYEWMFWDAAWRREQWPV